MRPEDHRLVYVASPYTLYPMGPQRAFQDVARLAGELALLGYPIYSPILAGHPMAAYGRAPAVNHEWWKRFNEPMVLACDALLIAMMEGWKRSAGIADEVNVFASAGKPIYYLNPHDLRITQP